MNFFIGITDQAWFDTLSSLTPSQDEVNFWQPSPDSRFRAIRPGDLFLFKLHRSIRTGRRDLIAGGGVFARYSMLPISVAWDAKLFDRGYLSITPKLYIEVSSRIKKDFDNGEYYFTFHSKKVNTNAFSIVTLSWRATRGSVASSSSLSLIPASEIKKTAPKTNYIGLK